MIEGKPGYPMSQLPGYPKPNGPVIKNLRPPIARVPTLNYGRMIEGKQGAKEKLNCIVFRQTRCLDQGYKGKTKTIV